MLFFDPANAGKIGQANQFIFTDWDPTATSDMQALRDVFDTNHNGKLDAGDAKFASFKLMVTNADGTRTVETLAQAGIASVNLIPTDASVQEVDGSTVTGQASYTRTDGSTGAAGDAAFAYDGTGYVVKQTVTHNPDGSTTVDTKAFNPSGDLANETASTVSANGLSKTLTYDGNGDGTVDNKQTDVFVTNPDGSTTETISDYGDGGASLQDSFATDTTADRKTVTIYRDFTGGGIVQQKEVRQINNDGSSSDTVTDLNKDGTLVDSIVTTITASGLAKTVKYDDTGSGVVDFKTTQPTVVSPDGSRSETVNDVNETSVDGQSTKIRQDHTGSGTYDLTISSTTQPGSATTTTMETNADTSLRGEQITSVSSDGLTTTNQLDLTGDQVTDRTTSDSTVVDPSGTRTETVQVTSGNGILLSKSVTAKNADGITRTVTVDSNGDGHLDAQDVVAVDPSTGVTTDTASLFNPDGSSAGQTVTTTSADGLTKTVQEDHSGTGAYDLTIKDTTEFVGGNTRETLSQINADNSLRSKTIITTTPDDLTINTQTDLDGDGSADRVTSDAILISSGSRTETVSSYSNNNRTLLTKVTVSTSADRHSRAFTTTIQGVSNVVGLPEGSDISKILSQNSTIAAAYDSSSTFLALAEMGGKHDSGSGTEILSDHVTLTVDPGQLSGDLILGLYNPTIPGQVLWFSM